MRIYLLIMFFFMFVHVNSCLPDAHTKKSQDVDQLYKTIERYESLIEQVLTFMQAKKAVQDQAKHNQEKAAES